MDLVINQDFFQKYQISNLNDLQNHIKELVLPQVNRSNKKILLRLKLGGARKEFYSLINSQIADFPDGLDLRQSYFQARKKQPKESKFCSGKIKLLVHIRQGDTAFIKTPWDTFIPVYGKNSFTELKYPNEGGYADLIDVDDYYFFVKEFTKYLNSEKFSLVVSSDGYGKAFSLLFDNLDKFSFNSEQIKQLKTVEKLYEHKFNVFESFPNTSFLIGENDDNLYDLIQGTLEADIIILAFRNTLGMLLKIIAHYYDCENPPIIIELYKRRKPFDSKKLLGIDSRKATIIPVEINNYNWQELISKVNHAIASKTQII